MKEILKKQYKEQLPAGTNVEIDISVKLSDYNQVDYEELQSLFATSSRNFYLGLGRQIKSKIL